MFNKEKHTVRRLERILTYAKPLIAIPVVFGWLAFPGNGPAVAQGTGVSHKQILAVTKQILAGQAQALADHEVFALEHDNILAILQAGSRPDFVVVGGPSGGGPGGLCDIVFDGEETSLRVRVANIGFREFDPADFDPIDPPFVVLQFPGTTGGPNERIPPLVPAGVASVFINASIFILRNLPSVTFDLVADGGNDVPELNEFNNFARGRCTCEDLPGGHPPVQECE